jgi:hypothetical protein
MDRGVHYPVPEGSVVVAIPTPEDLDFLAANLRPEDVREVADSPFNTERKSVRDVLEEMALHPATRVARHRGVPYLVFGVTVLEENGMRVAYPWLMGTPAMVSFHKGLFVQARKWLSAIREDCDAVFNYFDIRNETHIKWALRMGFRPTQALLNNYYLGMIL